MNRTYKSSQALAAAITKAASLQTYYTIRFFVDRDRIHDAYRAYAYFRWVDDCLDLGTLSESERLAFLDRQKTLMENCYQGKRPRDLPAEEQMLADLIQGDQEKDSGLQSYIRNMMAVMAFDSNRRDQLISREELEKYAQLLATAVTEALHHFIGNGNSSPQGETRYLAVIAAHITHMLRDTLDDTRAGYFNIPREFLETHSISPQDVNNEAYRMWVRDRVQLARTYFEAGKNYLARVENPRCRIAGWAYIARFEVVLNAIEKDNYRLREEYSERKKLGTQMMMLWSVLSQTFNQRQYEVLPALTTR